MAPPAEATLLGGAMSYEVALGIAGFILNFLGLVGAGMMAVNRIASNFAKELIKLEREFDQKREADLRMIGESLQALRTKVGEVELYSERQFARRQSVHDSMNRINDSIAEVKTDLNREFEKLESKFENMTRTG